MFLGVLECSTSSWQWKLTSYNKNRKHPTTYYLELFVYPSGYKKLRTMPYTPQRELAYIIEIKKEFSLYTSREERDRYAHSNPYVSLIL